MRRCHLDIGSIQGSDETFVGEKCWDFFLVGGEDIVESIRHPNFKQFFEKKKRVSGCNGVERA